MAVDPTLYYRTLTDADAYFLDQLYAEDWTGADPSDKDRALLAATRAVDSLQFRGMKKAVYDLLVATPDATDAQIAAAYASQGLQFPRDDQAVDTVPDDVFWGVCEEAMSLLAARDPQQEFRDLALNSDGIGTNRTSSDRARMAHKHVTHMITSPLAWKYLSRWIDKETHKTFKIAKS